MIKFDPTAIYLVDESNKDAISLAKKLSKKEYKPGDLIFVSKKELACFNNGSIKTLEPHQEIEKSYRCPNCGDTENIRYRGYTEPYNTYSCDSCGHQYKEHYYQ